MAELTVATAPAEELHAWSRDAYRLRMVSHIYVSLAVAGLVSLFVPITTLTIVVGEMSRYGSFFAFLVGWAFAFRVQSKLYAAHHVRTGAWAVAVVGLALLWIFDEQGFTNGGWLLFWLLGTAILLGVFANSNRVTRRLQQG